MTISHGTDSRYRGGCRCDACRTASSAVRRTYRDRAKERCVLVDGRLVAPVPPEQHGREATYVNHWCRCDVCVEAHREDVAQHRERRFAARTLVDGRLTATAVATHGSATTYGNHGCRCRPCTDAALRDHASRKGKVAS